MDEAGLPASEESGVALLPLPTPEREPLALPNPPSAAGPIASEKSGLGLLPLPLVQPQPRTPQMSAEAAAQVAEEELQGLREANRELETAKGAMEVDLQAALAEGCDVEVRCLQAVEIEDAGQDDECQRSGALRHCSDVQWQLDVDGALIYCQGPSLQEVLPIQHPIKSVRGIDAWCLDAECLYLCSPLVDKKTSDKDTEARPAPARVKLSASMLPPHQAKAAPTKTGNAPERQV
jgi:hypothetical protein